MANDQGDSVSLTDHVVQSGLLRNDPGAQQAFTIEPDRAIEQVWLEHESKLSEKDKRFFAQLEGRAEDKLDAYMSRLRQICDVGNTDRLLRSFRAAKPIFDSASVYLPLLLGVSDSLSPISPLRTLLGGLTSVVEYSKRYEAFHEQLVQTLEFMAKRLELVQSIDSSELGRLKPLHPLIFDLYMCVLDACRSVYSVVVDPRTGERRHSIKVSWKVLLRSPDHDFTKIRNEFNDKYQLLKAQRAITRDTRFGVFHTLQIDQNSEAKEMMRGMEARLSDRIDKSSATSLAMQKAKALQGLQMREHEVEAALRSSILAWLPSTPYRSDYRDIYAKHMEGSGAWLFLHDDFKAWRDSSRSSMLRVVGGPGSGKSTLASVVVNELEWHLAPDAAVLYFFCKRHHGSQQMHQIIGTLLHQLAAQSPALEPVLRNLYDVERSFVSQQPHLSAMQKPVQTYISRFSHVYIVADGLDECAEQQSVASALCDLCDSADGIVKIITFSRPGHRGLKTLQERSRATVAIDDGANVNDIDAFIDREVDRLDVLMPGHPDLMRDVRSQVKANSKGIFIYAVFMMQNLLAQYLPNDVRSRLSGLPTGLDNIWDAALARLESRATRDLAIKVILVVYYGQCLGCSPMTKLQLAHAVAVTRGMTSLDPEAVLPVPDDMGGLCENLVTLTSQGTAELCHESFRTHLDTRAEALRLLLVGRGSTIFTASNPVVDICLTYANLEDARLHHTSLFKDRAATLVSYPLLTYCVNMLARQADMCSRHINQQLMSSITDNPSLRESCLIALHDGQVSQKNDMSTTHSSKIHIMAAWGLVESAELAFVSDTSLFARAKEEGLCGFTAYKYSFNHGHHGMSRLLLQHAHSEFQEGANAQWPWMLKAACDRGWPDLVTKLLSYSRFQSNARESVLAGMQSAARNNDVAILKVFHDNSSDMNMADVQGMTPFLCAVESDSAEAWTYLLPFSDIHARTTKGFNALHLAICSRNPRSVKSMIDAGADFEAGADIDVGADTDTVLDINALVTGYGKSSATAYVLLKNFRSYVDKKTKKQATASSPSSSSTPPLSSSSVVAAAAAGSWTPLLLAVLYNLSASAALLIDLGADPMVVAEGHFNALTIAIASKSAETVKLLLRDGRILATINRPVCGFATALDFASASGALEFVECLIQHGAHVNPPADHSDSMTPLAWAVRARELDVARLLVKHGASVHVKFLHGRTLLHRAARPGADEMMAFLLDQKIDTSVVESGLHRTALLSAAMRRAQDVALQLAAASTDETLNRQTAQGFTALHLAAFHGMPWLVRYLACERRVPFILNENRVSAFHAAAWQGHVEILEVLSLRAGAEAEKYLSARDRYGDTLLTFAARAGSVDVVRWLAQRININEPDSHGNTALFVAAALGHIQTFRALLDLTPDILHTNRQGLNVLCMCVLAGRCELVNILMQHKSSEELLRSCIASPLPCLAVASRSRRLVEQFWHLVDPSALTTSGYDILNFSVAFLDIANTELLIERFPQLLDVKSDMDPPLFVASGSGRSGMVRELLKKPSVLAQIDLGSVRGGTTPLQAALLAGCRDSVNLLLEAGANPNIVDRRGRNAFAYNKVRETRPLGLENFWRSPWAACPTAQDTICLDSLIQSLQAVISMETSTEALGDVGTAMRHRFQRAWLLWEAGVCSYFLDQRNDSLSIQTLVLFADLLKSKATITSDPLQYCAMCHAPASSHLQICRTCDRTRLCTGCLEAYQSSGDQAPKSVRECEEVEQATFGLYQKLLDFGSGKVFAVLSAKSLMGPDLERFVRGLLETGWEWLKQHSKGQSPWRKRMKESVDLLNSLVKAFEVAEVARGSGTMYHAQMQSREDDINDRFEAWLRDKGPMFGSILFCKGHRYYRRSADEIKTLQEDDAVFDSNGVLRITWLQSALTHFRRPHVCGPFLSLCQPLLRPADYQQKFEHDRDRGTDETRRLARRLKYLDLAWSSHNGSPQGRVDKAISRRRSLDSKNYGVKRGKSTEGGHLPRAAPTVRRWSQGLELGKATKRACVVQHICCPVRDANVAGESLPEKPVGERDSFTLDVPYSDEFSKLPHERTVIVGAEPAHIIQRITFVFEKDPADEEQANSRLRFQLELAVFPDKALEQAFTWMGQSDDIPPADTSATEEEESNKSGKSSSPHVAEGVSNQSIRQGIDLLLGL